MNNIRKSVVRCLMASCLLTSGLIATSASWAANLDVKALNKSGEAMPDVVVYATPIEGKLPPFAQTEVASIAQDHLQFTPYVTAVRAGAQIKFPNYDKVEHHVKSFSAPKEFEIKPYEKTTPPPIVFDKAGVVVLYCLIHEWMRAYVYVVDTPYFGKTDATGQASLQGLPPGNYEIRAWHPDMGNLKQPLLQTVQVTANPGPQIKFDFDFIAKKRKPAKVSP